MSISLAVKDLQVSKAFYEKLGFTVFGGAAEHKYLIMKNGDTNIGLFEGMFDNNIITFNPGWDSDAKNLDKFSDVRKIHESLTKEGVTFAHEEIETESGPASFSLHDPDGNMILVDQHV